MEPLAEEESEMSVELGRVLRVVLGAELQLKESAERKRYAATRETQGIDAHRDKDLAWSLRQELGSAAFWNKPGAQAVADRMTVAGQLAPEHVHAARAYMDGADRLRTGFGINIEEINRDHPGSAAERHAALRAALDDYLAAQRALAEASESRESAEKEPPDAGAGEAPTALDPHQEAGDEATPGGAPAEVESEALDRFFTARADEQEHLVDAEVAGAEEHRDIVHALAQEALDEHTQGQDYERVDGAQRARIGDPALAAVRGRQGQNFPQPTSERVGAATKPTRHRGKTFTVSRQRENTSEVSR